MTKVIWFVGEIGCGKWTAIDYLAAKYGAVSFRYSAILRTILNSLFIPINRENLQTLSTNLRQNFGQDLFAKVIAENIKKTNADIVVIDGIRRIEDIEHIKDLDWFILIYVESDVKIRFDRTKNRWENLDERNLSLERFVENSKAETETKIRDLKNISNFVINNDWKIEGLYKEIDKIVKEL